MFPVYGAVSYGDSFGAPRADTIWHHGDDIFAPLGAPVLAVSDGTVFSVGRNPIGGNRFWLRDLAGNEFYYAHLSAFAPDALNGNHVRAGDVIGFVGNTGDAEGTPYHLHFEVHPASLLVHGEDGVVNPTPYLHAWQHLADVAFPTYGHLGADDHRRAECARRRRDAPSGERHLERERPRPGVADPGLRPIAVSRDGVLLGARNRAAPALRVDRRLGRVAVVGELASGHAALHPAARLGPRERVEQHADRNAEQEEEARAEAVRLVPLVL